MFSSFLPSFPYLGLSPASADVVPPLAPPAASHFSTLYVSYPIAVVVDAADNGAAARTPACHRLAGRAAVAAVVGVAWERKLNLDVLRLFSLLVGRMEWMAPIQHPFREMAFSPGRVGHGSKWGELVSCKGAA